MYQKHYRHQKFVSLNQFKKHDAKADNGLVCNRTHNKMVFLQSMGIGSNYGKTKQSLKEDNFLAKPHFHEGKMFTLLQ